MTSKIVAYKQYVAGWLDSTIHDFLPSLSSADASTKYALITCLDSHRSPADLRSKSPELKRIAKKLEVVGTGLLLPTELLLEMDAANRIFFGFDEVWFFPGSDIEPKPPAATLVGPARLNRTRLKEMGKWLADGQCSLALGGGEGLNFVVKAHGLVGSLLGHTIEQPESAYASA